MIWSWKKIFLFILFANTICCLFMEQRAVAYIPDGEVVGLSKIARTLEVFAKRFQLQERLTAQIADVFMEELKPHGVMVLIEAEHMCMTMRGIKKPGTKTVTVVTRGVFNDDEKTAESVLSYAGAEMIWKESIKYGDILCGNSNMEHLAEYEKNRIFCRHGMDHLMDVARIAYIENLEKNCGISKEIIYGAALLHDIGRYLQYTEGIPHERAEKTWLQRS